MKATRKENNLRNYTDLIKNEILNNFSEQPLIFNAFLAGIVHGKSNEPHIKICDSARKKLINLLSRHLTICSKNKKIKLLHFGQLAVRQKFVQTINSNNKFTSLCLKAFLQGLFLTDGYIQNPAKSYQLEIRIKGRWKKAAFKKATSFFKISFKSTEKATYTVFYLKKSRRIVKFLKILGSIEKSLELSDFRAVREILSNVNRQVNFETANINRQVFAAHETIEQIKELLELHNQDLLTPKLKETALIRVEYPHESLESLGRFFNPPLSKSAINHRLRRIKSIHNKYFKNSTKEA